MPRLQRGSRPIDPRTGEPLEPKSQPGYYPGFRTMSQMAFWDEATRRVIVARVERHPSNPFFHTRGSAADGGGLRSHPPARRSRRAHKIPIVNAIDERLYENRLDGYRYEDMPPDQEAHRLGLQGIAEVAQHMFGKPFLDLSALDQESVLETLHDGNPPAGTRHLEANGCGTLLAPPGAGRRGSLLRAPLRLGRNRFRRPGLSTWLYAPGGRRARAMGSRMSAATNGLRLPVRLPQNSPRLEASEEHKASPGQGGTH